MISKKSIHFAAALVTALTVPGLAKDFRAAPPADPFRDVTEEHWAFEAVDWLRKKGLLEGWGAQFHGRRNFSRYEMAEILARFTQKLERARDQYEADGGAPAGDLRDRLQQIRSRFGTRGSTTDVAQLREDLHRVAALVATHQVLLERPSSQANWRQNLGMKGSRASGAEPGRTLELASKVPDPAHDALMAELNELTAEEVRQAALVEAGKVEGVGPRSRIQDALARLRVDKSTLAAARTRDRHLELAEAIQLSKSLRGAKGPPGLEYLAEPEGASMASLDDAPAISGEELPTPQAVALPSVAESAPPALPSPPVAPRPLPAGVVRKDGRARARRILPARTQVRKARRPAVQKLVIPPGAMIGPSLIEARAALTPSTVPAAPLPAAAPPAPALPAPAPVGRPVRSRPSGPKTLSTADIQRTNRGRAVSSASKAAPQRMTLQTGPGGARLTPSGTRSNLPPAIAPRSHPRLLEKRVGADIRVPPPPVPARPEQDAVRRAHEAKLAKARAAAKAAQDRVAELERNRSARRQRDRAAEARADAAQEVTPAPRPARRPAPRPALKPVAPRPRSVLAMAPNSVRVPGGSQVALLRRTAAQPKPLSPIRTAPLVASARPSAPAPTRAVPAKDAPKRRAPRSIAHSIAPMPKAYPQGYPSTPPAPRPVRAIPRQPRRLANPLSVDPVRSPALAHAQAQVPVGMSPARSEARAILAAVRARRETGLPVVARPLPPEQAEAATKARNARLRNDPNFRPGLILPGQDLPTPAPTYGEEPDQQRRLLAALEDVRAGRVSREQAEVIVRLASLAFQTTRSEWF